MQPVAHTVINSVPAPVDRVFGILTDPGRIPDWLPGCSGVQCEVPLKKGVRLKVRFGDRMTEFEVVDFTAPTTFGWVERGQRKGWKTLFRLDAAGGSTAVTIRDVWTPRSLVAWLRGRFLEKRKIRRELDGIVQNLRKIVAP